MTPSVFVSIVTFNHGAVIAKALTALQRSSGVSVEIHVTDNYSVDDSYECVRPFEVFQHQLKSNLGFCGGHNSIIERFLKSSHTHLCILNPDVAVEPDCLATLANNCEQIATPKLLRGDDKLQAVSPTRVDAAGMIITKALRHFDRGSQQLDGERFSRGEMVFGGTGACLMLTRAAVEALLLPATPFDAVLSEMHPTLTPDAGRKMLFDEAFFAYREDAELAWRAQRFGIGCCYVPRAVAVHKRAVLPENRGELSDFINYLGVRNRFLLQALHLSGWYFSAILPGLIVRNIVVIAAVLLRERSSIRAFSDLWKLRKRAWYLRRWISSKATVSGFKVARWMGKESEAC